MEKKKKSKDYIIPATFFISTNNPVGKNNTTAKDELSRKTTKVLDTKESAPPKKTLIPNRSNKVSGLSLSSIRKKKEHQSAKLAEELEQEILPTDDFQESQLIIHWKEYVKKLDKDGSKIVASIFDISDKEKREKLKVDGTVINIEVPNASMQMDIHGAQYGILSYIRKKLNNYDISIQVIVNEEVSKKYVFSATDKFDKLLELNPVIGLLRTEFGLDIKD